MIFVLLKAVTGRSLSLPLCVCVCVCVCVCLCHKSLHQYSNCTCQCVYRGNNTAYVGGNKSIMPCVAAEEAACNC